MSCESIEDAMKYIKGYCMKHNRCESCRLYDITSKQCFLYGEEPPCDWVIEDEEEFYEVK